jgi:hydroxymethylbilane synthase
MATPTPTPILAATRGSALARWQTDHVAALLGADVSVEPVIVETTADRNLDIPIWDMGGKGVFVKEVQAAVLDGRARLAVHSGKDLPAGGHPDLVIAAVPQRGDPRDAMVGSTLDGLAPGAVVATGSVRRRSQIAWLRPDLSFVGLRGNIATRLARIPPGGAIVMAAAALDRLDLRAGLDVTIETLGTDVLLPQVAQGALAVECRADDDEAIEMLARIQHRDSRVTFDAERAFLAELGGDCDLPAGAYAVRGADATITIEAVLASLDGHVVLRVTRTGTDPEAVGRQAARALLVEGGGSVLLDR